MPKTHISRSITINAPIDKVYATLNDFNQWVPWSPWLIMEPGVKVTVAPDSKYYEWEGNRVGAGNMTVLANEENAWIDYDLTFLKPWKSKAKVRFELQQEGEGVKVTWLMDSSLPFFMFFMKKMMEAYIGSDYERGLGMLKVYIETGEVPSKLDFKGISNYEGCQYIGIKTECSIAQVGERMQDDFGKVGAYAGQESSNVAGPMFSIYHKWDMVKGIVHYTAAIPVKEIPANLSAGFLSGHIPATQVYTLRHTGAYEHLGNAWGTLYAMHRGKEFKPKKGIHPFEVYLNNPEETAPKDLITEISFAVK